MTTSAQKQELREHLALISLESYLMLRAEDEDARIERYNMVQQEIDAILNVIEDSKPITYSCPDIILR